MTMEYLFQVSWAAIMSSVAYFYASMGGLISEKAGVLNLGLEGYMMAGAAAGIITLMNTGSSLLAFIVALGVGALVGSIYALSVVNAPTNQVISGMSLVFLLTNISNFYGQSYTGKVIQKIPEMYFVFMAIPTAVAVWFVLNKTRCGLHLRAVGQNAKGADSAGISVFRYRFAATVICGIFAAVSGFYVSMSLLAFWSADLTGGRGWIAWGLVMFAKWRPMGILRGALVFGVLSIAPYGIQAIGIAFPQSVLFSLQYLAPLLIMMMSSGGTGEPGGLGIPCQRD